MGANWRICREEADGCTTISLSAVDLFHKGARVDLAQLTEARVLCLARGRGGTDSTSGHWNFTSDRRVVGRFLRSQSLLQQRSGVNWKI